MTEPTPDYAGTYNEFRKLMLQFRKEYRHFEPCHNAWVKVPVDLADRVYDTLQQAAALSAHPGEGVTREEVKSCVTMWLRKQSRIGLWIMEELYEEIDALFTSPPVPADKGSEGALKDCTCVGFCKGPERLGSGWRCVLFPKSVPAAAQREEVERMKASIAELKEISTTAMRGHTQAIDENAALESALADANEWKTHGDAWNDALIIARDTADGPENRNYWAHEISALKSALSAPSPVEGKGEKPAEADRPTMLVIHGFTDTCGWQDYYRPTSDVYWWHKSNWSGNWIAFTSKEIRKVDRDASDDAALALYDADLAAGGGE